MQLTLGFVRRLLGMLSTLGLLAAAPMVLAETPENLLERYTEQAKASDPAFDGFSAERGRAFYLQKHPLMGVGAVSCASCHRKNPREQILEIDEFPDEFDLKYRRVDGYSIKARLKEARERAGTLES